MWGVVRRHTALGILKVFSDPQNHMKHSSVMTISFPGHNLVFSFQGMAGYFTGIARTKCIALSPFDDAYLSNETTIAIRGLKHAVQVYSIIEEEELSEKLRDERNDLINEVAYKDEINFAYHSGIVCKQRPSEFGLQSQMPLHLSNF